MGRFSRRIRFSGFLFALFGSILAMAEVRLVREDSSAGLELWETKLGRLWIPKPGAAAVIRHLESEQAVEKVYSHRVVHVKSGDIVVDCGAHIGGFTRNALLAGARLVVAVEPEKFNAAAFRRNFAEAIRNRKVILVEKAVGDRSGSVALHISKVGDSHSTEISKNAGRDQVVELTTIDQLAASLKLPRIDFIKFDIEGAEVDALKGAEQSLKKWHPRLAVSSYHKKEDPESICALIWKFRPGYLIASKDRLRRRDGSETPKVLFFF